MHFILIISSTHDFGLVTIQKKLINDEGYFEHPIIILWLTETSWKQNKKWWRNSTHSFICCTDVSSYTLIYLEHVTLQNIRLSSGTRN